MRKAVSTFAAVCAMTLAAQSHAAEPAAITPASVPQFFVEPNQPAELLFKTSADAASQAYTVVDYWGKSVSSGQATTKAGGMAVSLTLPAGYYELRTGDQVFGVMSQPAYAGKADPFFGIDAALSWLDQDADARRGFITILKRSGIAFARERMGMTNVNPAAGKYDFKTKRDFDAVRQEYQKHGVAVLDMIDTPGPHFRSADTLKTIRYADTLGPLAKAWEPIVKQYSSSWNALEVSNEPELAPWPADQYVPLVKLAAYAQQKAGSRVPLVGGVFGGNAPGPFHDICSASGMLDVVDAISFHTYDKPELLGNLVKQYRKWMAASGKESMPLWLTEAGKPWTIGPPRAPIEEDSASAAAIAGLTIEARANGISKFCAFVLPYYEEGGLKSFSMMGRDRSPMRMMAGYVNAVRVLSNQPYVGDLGGVPSGVIARVFGSGNERLIAIHSADGGTNRNVSLGLKPTRLEGIDGRSLQMNADGSIPVPDGVVYAWADASAVSSLLKTDSDAARLYAVSQRTAPTRGEAPSVVLQHPLASEKGKMSPRRYLLSADVAKAMPLKVRIDNMSDVAQSVTVTPKLPGNSAVSISPKTVSVPAGGQAYAEWTIDATGALDAAELRAITVEAKAASGKPISPLAIPYQTEGTLADHLKRNAYQLKLPITDTKRWQPNIVSHGKLQMAAAGDLFKFDVSYTKPGERWAYPRFVLREPIDAKRARGFLVRARIAKPGSNIALMVMQDGKPGFWSMEVMPADGAWHVFYVPFADLQAMPGNPDMQNAIINPAKFTGVQIGMKSQDATNSMEISDVLIVGPE